MVILSFEVAFHRKNEGRIMEKIHEYLENEEYTIKEESESVLRRNMIEKWRKIYFEESVTMIALLEHDDANELTKDEKEYLLEWSGDDEYAYVSDNGEIVLIEDEEVPEV